jgi:hypothetical protein
MKLCTALFLFAISAINNTVTAFVAVIGTGTTATAALATTTSTTTKTKTSALHAEIRGPTAKNDVLEFGWDGTTALGGAVDNSKPARLLDDIRASGETQSEACQLFNANLGMFSFICSLEQY